MRPLDFSRIRFSGTFYGIPVGPLRHPTSAGLTPQEALETKVGELAQKYQLNTQTQISYWQHQGRVTVAAKADTVSLHRSATPGVNIGGTEKYATVALAGDNHRKVGKADAELKQWLAERMILIQAYVRSKKPQPDPNAGRSWGCNPVN